MPRLVAHFTDSTVFGGAEQMLLALIAGLQQTDVDQVLVHHQAQGLSGLLDAVTELGVETVAVEAMPEGWAGAAQIPRFARAIRQLRPDVFHAHLTWSIACKFALAGAAAARVPAVIATHQLYVDFPMNGSRRLQQRLIGHGIDRHVAVSRHVAERLVETFPWLAERVTVIPNAVDAARFRGQPDPELRRELSAGTSARLVLVPARLASQKGQRYAIEAVTALADVRLVFAGDGPDRASLEAYSDELGVADRVIFLGHRDDVPRLLASCDAAMLPSLYEGLPVAVLEAMASGCPVVATRIGGTDEAIVDGQTGLLVPPSDGRALARGIDRLLSDAALAKRLAASGRAEVEAEYSTRQLVSRNEQLYAELAARA